jgi:tetratricopeptide (TPR) repeat protein
MTDQDALYDRIVRHGASSETLRILLAEYRKNDHPGKALQECIKAVRAYPEDPFLRQMLAECYTDVGFLSQAEMELETIISQMDVLMEVYKLQANIYRKQNRCEEALRSLRIYLAHRPEDVEALEALETLAPPAPEMEAPADQIEKPAPLEEPQVLAEEKPERHEESDPSKISTSTLAEVYVNQGEIEEALGIYQRLLNRNPEDEAIRRRMEELRSMLQPEPFEEEKMPDEDRRKKERAIAILEGWLADLRRMYRGSAVS